MELFNSIPFAFEEENYDIRIFYDDVTINVVAFLNGYRANGYRYQEKNSKRVKVPLFQCQNPPPYSFSEAVLQDWG